MVGTTCPSSHGGHMIGVVLILWDAVMPWGAVVTGGRRERLKRAWKGFKASTPMLGLN